MEWISLIPAKPKEFGGGGLDVEHGSWSDGDRKEAGGVTPLWTVFHLYNYFWRYFANFGILANFYEKRPKLFDKINRIALSIASFATGGFIYFLSQPENLKIMKTAKQLLETYLAATHGTTATDVDWRAGVSHAGSLVRSQIRTHMPGSGASDPALKSEKVH